MRNLYFCTRIPLLILGALFFVPILAHTQQQIRNQGGLDGDVSLPKLSQASAHTQDPAAIAELQAYVGVTGLGAWRGMQATGTSTYADKSEPLSTTLSILPGNKVKLVVTSSKGDSVTITNGVHGHVQSAGGDRSQLPALTVAGGIAPFDLPGLVTQFPSVYAVVDGGTAILDGSPLHKVTVEADLSHSDGIDVFERRAATDLYFDPSTHLLQKSAMIVLLPGAGRHRFLRVVTYGSYAPSGSFQLPTLISETLDGRPTWSLQLTTVNTTTLPANNLF